MSKNISLTYIDGQEPRIEVKDSPKEILNVNGVRLSERSKHFLSGTLLLNSNDLETALTQHFKNDHVKNELLRLREQNEEITYENDTCVVVPHGNAKNIAVEDGKAFIVSTIDQSQSSLEFFKNASGEQLADFFNAAAKTIEQEDMHLAMAFAVIHIRENADAFTQSPQKYAHIHLTDKRNLSTKLASKRTWVKRPSGFVIDSNMVHLFSSNHKNFNVHSVTDTPESKLHRIISNPEQPMDKMLKEGTPELWKAWRDILFTDKAITQSIEEGGIRLTIERGVMHVHGGEPLYQGNIPTRWSAEPKFS